MHKLLSFVKEHSFTCAVILWLFFITYVFVTHFDHAAHECPEAEPKVVHETVYIELESDDRAPYYRDVTESMSESEYHLLAALVKEESGNQSHAGQRAVVEVVFNRVLDDRFPDSIEEVITANNQFSTLRKLPHSEPTQEQYDAIDAVASEVEPILPQEVVYFANKDTGRPLYEKIGGHYFFYG